MTIKPPILDAADMAVEACQRIKQKRKFTDEPYETHLGRVVGAYQTHPRKTEDRVCALWLHDSIEDDTGTTYNDIIVRFNIIVAKYVDDLTNTSKILFPDYNRKQRKKVDIARIAQVCTDSKIMKAFDRIDNVTSLKNDFLGKVHPDVTSGYCRLYAGESLDLLNDALFDCGDNRLLDVLNKVCHDLIRHTREEDERQLEITEVYNHAHSLHVHNVKRNPGRVPPLQKPILELVEDVPGDEK